MRRLGLGISLLSTMAIACGTQRDRPPPGNNRDAGAQPDTGMPPPLTGPIIERTADVSWDCVESLPVVEPADRWWAGFGWTHEIANVQGTVMFGRVEQEGDPLINPGSSRVLVSTIETDGTLGAPTAIAVPDPTEVTSAAVAAAGTKLLFVHTDATGLNASTVEGGTATDPKPVIGAGGQPLRAQVVTTTDRGAVVLGVRNVDDRTSYLVQPITLDGAPDGASLEIVRGAKTFVDPSATIAATDVGWAAAWYDKKTDAGEIYFRRLTADATPDGDVKTVATADQRGVTFGGGFGFAGSQIQLLPIPGGFLLAWVESWSNDDFENPEGWSMVTIAKLDEAGALIGEPEHLAAIEPHFDSVEPELVMHGDAVAVLWGRADRIYVCGGCVPNHDVRLVLLDPERMIPISDVTTLGNESGGGFLFRSSASTGTEILSVFRVVFHVHSTAGLGGFTCTPR